LNSICTDIEYLFTLRITYKSHQFRNENNETIKMAMNNTSIVVSDICTNTLHKKTPPEKSGGVFYIKNKINYFFSAAASAASSSSLALIPAKAPKSPNVAFSTFAWIVFTAVLVFSTSPIASFLAALSA